ncbi:MAG: hypothetical protein AAB473_02620 [Patescibacteria group bacterium]
MQGAQGGNGAGLLWELGGDILRFPAWWYGKGLLRAATYAMEFVQGYVRSIGVMTWARNMFVPMFGRYDWQSRIISVFMRLVNVVGRGFVTIIVAAIVLGIFAFYVALPGIAVAFILFHATSILSL